MSVKFEKRKIQKQDWRRRDDNTNFDIEFSQGFFWARAATVIPVKKILKDILYVLYVIIDFLKHITKMELDVYIALIQKQKLQIKMLQKFLVPFL